MPGLLNQSQSHRPALHNSDPLSLGPRSLDLVRRILRRDGEPLALPSRQFDLPAVLVERAGQVLSKDELIDVAWRGIASSG